MGGVIIRLKRRAGTLPVFVERLNKLVAPKSKNIDLSRQEYILNVLVFAAGFMVVAAFLVYVFILFSRPNNLSYENAIPIYSIVILLAVFGSLYLLSRRGLFRLASLILLGILFLLPTYFAYKWGVDVPAAIVLYPIIVVMSGVLISSRFSFFMAALIALTMFSLGHWQRTGAIPVNQYWKNDLWNQADLIMIVVIYFVIATVSWLANREIDKSLTRAIRSERALKKERDSLKIAVEKRTNQLKKAQAERLTQLYRLAEFGRLSSGLIHDIVNPLTAVSLNLGRIKNTKEGQRYVGGAVRAAKRLERMVASVRRQFSHQESKEQFSVAREIKSVIDILTHKSRSAGVKINFLQKTDPQIFGDAAKFGQATLNLIANAIDAGGKTVQVTLEDSPEALTLSVEDTGVGISKTNLKKIFEPFFTTKTAVDRVTGEKGGMGIGLSMTKRIIEEDFKGKISVTSRVGEGSTFRVLLPAGKVGSNEKG